jgi:APA family basic amino acid/polyamine antiporter
MTTDTSPGTSAEPASGKTALKRNISGRMLYLFILGDVLGAGIYALVGQIAGEVGGVTWVPMLVALGLALLTAASYAELVTKYPKAGGSAACSWWSRSGCCSAAGAATWAGPCDSRRAATR